jgi:hypothetical protein
VSAVLPDPSLRLDRSREQLRQSLHGAAAARERGSTSGRRPDEPATDLSVSLLSGALGHWWSRHPLRVAAILAARTTTAVVQPIAQTHPWSLVAGAFVAGGLAASTRPWQASKATLWTSLLPQLLLATVRAAPARSDRSPPR